jgi:hypothetical protein
MYRLANSGLLPNFFDLAGGQRLGRRQTQTVEFPQGDLIHHTRSVKPFSRLMHGLKNCRFSLAHRNLPPSIHLHVVP